mmetsp:Transcript_134520/g.348470  ORF Transcript_134520/g.348470 Transcript_134520/m.348470 type:complete len:358 (-) Transcript_134520:3347-4420(-)
MAVGLVREDHLDVVLGHPLPRVLPVVLADLRQGRERPAALQRADHGLRHGLHPHGGPEAELDDDLLAEAALHEALVEVLGLRALYQPFGMQPLRQEDPLIWELRDHEGEVRVHAVALGRHGEVTKAGLVIRTAIAGVLLLGPRPQELNGWDDNLIVGWDNLRERGDGARVEVHSCKGVSRRFEVLALRRLVLLDPLQRLEEEGEPLCSEVWETRKMDLLLLFLAMCEGRVRLQADAGGLDKVLCLLRAHERLRVQTLHHDPPNVLPAWSKGALEKLRLPALLLPQVDRQRRVLQVVELSLLAHDASNDGRGQVEDEVDVNQGAEHDHQPPCEDARDARDTPEAEPQVCISAHAPGRG